MITLGEVMQQLNKFSFDRLVSETKMVTGRQSFDPAGGVIFRIERIGELPEQDFSPNEGRYLSLAYLSKLMEKFSKEGFQFLPLSSIISRTTGAATPPFVSFLLDNPDQKTLKAAEPLFRHFNCPFAVAITTGLIDRCAFLHWKAFEHLLNQRDKIELDWNGEVRVFDCPDATGKQWAFDELSWLLRNSNAEEAHELSTQLEEKYALNFNDISTENLIEWDDVIMLSKNPAVEIVSSGVNYISSAGCTRKKLDEELKYAREILKVYTNVEARIFAYPAVGIPVSEQEIGAVQDADYLMAVRPDNGFVSSAVKDERFGLMSVGLNNSPHSAKYVKAIHGSGNWNSSKIKAKA